MVRFSCFHAHIHNHKPKKIGQPSTETMLKTLQDLSQSKVQQHSSQSTTITQSLVKTGSDDQVTHNANHMASVTENGRSVNQTCGLKKSQSLGSMPYGVGSAVVDNDSEDGIHHMFSCDSSQYRLQISDDGKDQGISISDQCKETNTIALESIHISSQPVITETIFSIADSEHREKEGGKTFGSSVFQESIGGPRKHTPHATQMIVKSCSMPNLEISSPFSDRHSPYRSLVPQSRSSEDLQLFDPGHTEMSLQEFEVQVNGYQSRDESTPETEKINFDKSLNDGDDSYPIEPEDCITPIVDEVNPTENQPGESIQLFDALPSIDFKIKRIEEWVSDLQVCSPLDEATEVSQSADVVEKDSNTISGSSAGRTDAKVIAGMEAAKRYISTMNAAATTAQLANHGLVAIPFLSAFVSLKVLNLSANAIGKITPGALPRGLHMLNLSKNNISTIEGLRELTRLRMLDLSYNRIFRIGHGLASCSSLKELYLAGNKISEVEGLHRLLKLNILDLRFNKISTIKSLGQLAANYNSLQAINLEGNPAQKNVGDDQLKKQMQGLLPHLAYYNRQPTKGSTLKDGADRAIRLGIGGHQLDHGIRPDYKSTRKMGHGVAAQRPSSSSTHGHRSQSKHRQGHISALPPKVSGNTPRHHQFDISSRPTEFKSDSFIRRSRSEGTLGNL